jgi:hypothetical protein
MKEEGGGGGRGGPDLPVPAITGAGASPARREEAAARAGRKTRVVFFPSQLGRKGFNEKLQYLRLSSLASDSTMSLQFCHGVTDPCHYNFRAFKMCHYYSSI